MHYVVTGRYYNSRNRFRLFYSNLKAAMMVNLWNGSVWGVNIEGKRKLIKRVNN